MKCIRTEQCPMYAKFHRVSELDTWLTEYCLGDFERCARLVRFRAREKVIDDLLPDGSRRAL